MSEDEFKINDLNHPLYEYSQVFTQQELYATIINLTELLERTPRYRFIFRRDLETGITLLKEMYVWLRQGKPRPV